MLIDLLPVSMSSLTPLIFPKSIASFGNKLDYLLSHEISLDRVRAAFAMQKD